MGATAALAGFSGCRNKPPLETIFAFNNDSAELIAGEPQFFATTFPMPGFVQGLLVESHEGHPTKIEGHPDHPASQGATGLFAQASILDLYSPFRVKTPLGPDQKKKSWDVFRAALQNTRKNNGAGQTNWAIVTGDVNSPTLASQLRDLLKREPHTRIYSSEPVPLANRPEIDFTKAKRIVSIDWDFLGVESGGVRHPLAFTKARRESGGLSRLYVVESAVSITGSQADHRWAFSSPDLVSFVLDLEKSLEGEVETTDTRILALASDLRHHVGECAIVAGFSQPRAVQESVRRMNEKIKALGKTIFYDVADRGQAPFTAPLSLNDLATDLEQGQIEALLILGGDPVATAPRDLKLASRLKRAAFSAHLTSFANETSNLCQWILPESHFLEAWSDAVSRDGSESLIQPLLLPIHDSVSSHDVLNWLLDRTATSYETVRSYWLSRVGHLDFDRQWQNALASGLWKTTSKKARSAAGTSPDTSSAHADFEASASRMEVIFKPDLALWDGRYSENPWLQELPNPLTQLTWDNALCLSPQLAHTFDLKNGDVVRISNRNGSLEAPVFIQPGLPPETMSLTLGFGRRQTGPVAAGSGFDANALRSSRDLWRADVTSLEKTGRRYELACTQTHHDMGSRSLLVSTSPGPEAATATAARPVAQTNDIGRGERNPNLPAELYDSTEQWAMTIDTDSCIGCGVCVIACQAENNIPVVGKKMVMFGREMHWIRIDRYVPQTANAVVARPLPVTCMHCETAPCEVVCPVQATNHSSTGLNQMVYNRCVGTRYCSNNCPYKVRRFNFFKFAENADGPLALQRNPEVTVRSRGVMEKCTYCVQRIEAARIDASKENRSIRDGEIRTACQQACPTRAITFGNLKDPKSQVNRMRGSRRSYGLLTELGTRPRTTYLAHVHFPNPDVTAPR
jgi:molybdopterin-containing oxidoreductase family iron-sulfur binding subunit